jgi:uncharacterized protein YcbX
MTSHGIRVAGLLSTPVKGLRVSARSEVTLGRAGVRGDRRFFLVDARGRMVNGKHLGALNEVSAELDDREARLALRFPGGEVVSAAIELGEPLQVSFFSRPRPAVQLRGPFSAALSEHAGTQLRVVQAAAGASAIDRGALGAVTIISRASLAALARAAAVPDVDSRRFRMSVELLGVDAHEEDGWVDRELALGEARVRVNGHVGRCLVTSRHPESGEADLPTLEVLRSYRHAAETTEPLAIGVYGEVRREGRVRVGDRVTLL